MGSCFGLMRSPASSSHSFLGCEVMASVGTSSVGNFSKMIRVPCGISPHGFWATSPLCQRLAHTLAPWGDRPPSLTHADSPNLEEASVLRVLLSPHPAGALRDVLFSTERLPRRALERAKCSAGGELAGLRRKSDSVLGAATASRKERLASAAASLCTAWPLCVIRNLSEASGLPSRTVSETKTLRSFRKRRRGLLHPRPAEAQRWTPDRRTACLPRLLRMSVWITRGSDDGSDGDAVVADRGLAGSTPLTPALGRPGPITQRCTR